MKVSSQLFGSFTLVVLLMAVSIGFGLSRMSQIQYRLDDIVTDKVRKLEAVHGMADATREESMAARGLLLSNVDALSQQYKDRIDQARANYEAAYKRL